MATTYGPYTPVSGSALSFSTQNVPDDHTREDSVLMNPMSPYPPPPPPPKFDPGYSNLDLDEKRKEYPSIFSIWWQEAGACFLVLAMMAAVVGTTFPHHDKPLPQWPYNLSINTLVAIYFIILKAAMLFVLSEALGQLKWNWFSEARPLSHLATYDDAARGPWGAFTFVWQLRGRAVLPSLGAIAIILSTVLDPFGQQIISFYQCTNLDPINLNATIPRGSFLDAGLGGRVAAGINKVHFEMQNAIHQGFYQAQPLTAPFTCATGTCTFPAKYGNAGWCNKCRDVTDRVVRVDYRLRSSNGSFFNTTLTNYTLPLPSDVTDRFQPNITVRALPGGTMRVRAFPRGMGTTIQVLFGAEDFNASSSNAHLYVPDSWMRKNRGAAECDISPCTQTYSANVAIGQLNETREIEAIEWGENIQTDGYRCNGIYQSSIDVSCLNGEEKTALTNAGYKIEPRTTWLAYNFSDLVSTNPDLYCWKNSTGIFIRPQCVYQLFNPTMLSMSTYFQRLFPNNNDVEDIFFHPYGPQGGPLAESIFQGGNVSYRSVEALFKRVVDSMTMYGRIHGQKLGVELSDPVVGQVWVTSTCVRVQWVWLIYPAVLVVMLFVFFIMSVWSARMGGELGRQNYKTSVLPLMFHTVERQGAAGSGGNAAMYQDGSGGILQTKEEIEREAELRVVLGKGEGGWRFKEI